MPQPRTPEDVKDDLTAMGLTIWTCHHPITFNYEWNGNGPKRGREDKSIVHLMLIGPGFDGAPGTGSSVREAVAAALAHPALASRQGGLMGAVATLGHELGECRQAIIGQLIASGVLDDDIPF